MKKTYIAPQADELLIEENDIICTSVFTDGSALDSSIEDADSRILDIIKGDFGSSTSFNFFE